MARVLALLRSDKDTHFTGALAQHASEEENIAVPSALGGSAARATLRVISIISDENLAWDVALWAKNTFQETDLDNDYFLGRWLFTTNSAFQIGATGAWYYHINGLDIPFVDMDNTGLLHVALINRSAAAKTAGAAGEVVILFWFEVE